MMISIRRSRGSTHLAVYVRLVAFLVATAGVILIPCAFAAAAAGHVSAPAAFATAAIAAALTLVAALFARSVDPLRG